MPDAPDTNMIDSLVTKGAAPAPQVTPSPQAPQGPAKFKVGDREMTAEEAAAEIQQLRDSAFSLTQDGLSPEVYDRSIRTILARNGWDQGKIDNYMVGLGLNNQPEPESNQPQQQPQPQQQSKTLDQILDERMKGVERQANLTRAQLLEQMQATAISNALGQESVKDLLKVAKDLNGEDHPAKVKAIIRAEADQRMPSALRQKVDAGHMLTQDIINEVANEVVKARVSALRSVIGTSPNIGKTPETAAMETVLQSLEAGKLPEGKLEYSPKDHPAIVQDKFVSWATAKVVNAAVDANKKQASGKSLTVA